MYSPDARSSPIESLAHSYLAVTEDGQSLPPVSAADALNSSNNLSATAMMSKVSLIENPNDQSGDGSTNSKDTVRGRRTDVSSSSKRR